MSGIAGLYNTPSSDEEFSTWSFIHAAHHRDIIRVIYQISGENLEDFVMDPFDKKDSGDWLQNHQVMHQQMDAILGVSGYNLLAVDLTDRDQFATWGALNADEHFKIANILGIG